MSELAQTIYEHLQSNPSYSFSLNLLEKNLEQEAIKELEQAGYIIVKYKTIGYLYAEIL